MNLKNKFLVSALIFLFAAPIINANQTNHIQTIYLGSGCFWGAEKGYEALDGVINAESGYANGYGIRPNYRTITQLKNKYNENNFAEVVKVTFNNNAISLEKILKHFLENHDPTQLNRQGNDIGTQYRSIIFFSSEDQLKVIENEISKINVRKANKLYEFIDNSDFYSNNIQKDSRSIMNIPFLLRNEDLNESFLQNSKEAGLLALKGHRSVGGMRASIYNALPEEAIDTLIEFMSSFEKKAG